MRNVKRNAAAVSAGALLAAFGLGGVLSAQAADTATPPPNPVVQHSAGDGRVNGTAGPEKEAQQAEDGPNQGPDANPNEPGHQDADESGEADAKGSEKSEKEAQQAEDGPNQGPDANPNEPGHQDADESGETK